MLCMTLLLFSFLLATPTASASEGAPTYQVTHAVAFPTADVSQLRWNWVEPRRLYIESMLQLPRPMWLLAEHNKERRILDLVVRTVLDCSPATRELDRVWEVMCHIEDISLSAAPVRTEAGRLAPVLQVLDDRLTGAWLQFQVHHDGRFLNVDLEGLDRPRRRSGVINENLRQIMSRVIAGMDLQVGDLPAVPEAVWPQFHTWLVRFPHPTSVLGATELLHRVEAELPDGRVLLASAGEGMLQTGDPQARRFEAFDTVISGWAVFDRKQDFLVERFWHVVGRPTASSVSASGFEGLPYSHMGRLVLLGASEAVDVGESTEISISPRPSTTLQQLPRRRALH